MKNGIFVSSLFLMLILSLSIKTSLAQKNIALNASDQTSNLVCGGGTEAQYATLLVDQTSAKLIALGHTVKIFYGITGTPNAVNTWNLQNGGAHAFVSMHTNATTGGCSGAASGTLTVINKIHKASDIELANKVRAGLVSFLKLADKGNIIWVNYAVTPPAQGNLGVLYGVMAPCCLEEALFHDNSTDAAILRSVTGQEKIANGVSSGINAYFGGSSINTGYASVSQGVTLSPSPVVSGSNFTASFTLKETKGSSITFESIVCAITNTSNLLVRDMEVKGPITISANGTYNYSSTLPWRTTDVAGNYKAVARGKIAGGSWFDFSVAGGVSPKDFQVIQSATASISNITFPSSVNAGSTFNLNYTITATGSLNVLLGASLRRNGIDYSNPANDISSSLVSGSNSKSRSFNLSSATPNPLPAGTYDVLVALWSDKNGNGIIDSPADVAIGPLYTSSSQLTINAACTAPTSPTSATASQTTITSGQSTTLQVNGGSLNSAPNWVWYAGNCSGSQVGTGSTLSVSPTSTTTYYVQASSNCGTTTCRSVTINVTAACTAPTSPTSATASQTTITSGQSTTLQVNGGSLNSAPNWVWYAGSCGGSQVGTGSALSVSPVSPTTYYVQASSNCGTTTCRSVTINVTAACTAPTSPTSATASQTTITSGQSTTLQVNGGALNSAPNWVWYAGSCGGSQVGTGSTLSVSPTSPTTYYVQASSNCGTTTCRSVTINVTASCTAPSAPASCTTSIGDPANGLEHRTNLSCDIVPGADGYFFEYSVDGTTWNTNWGPVTSNAISINHQDQPNVTRYYRVRAYKCEPVIYSNYSYASPQPIYTACDDAASPTVNGASPNSLNVTLNAETPVANPANTTYSIYCTTANQYVQTNGTLGSNEVFQTKNSWGTRTVIGLLNNKEYCFYAKAKNGNGDVRFNQANTGCATTQGTTLAAPVALAASGITLTGFNANWNASVTAIGYRLDIAMDNAFTNYLAGYQNKDVGNVTTTPITGLSAGTNYYYRVKVYNTSTTSDVSNIINVKTLSSIDAATLAIGNTSGSAGTTVSIPVSAIKFVDVVGFQFTIDYDKTKLDFVNCTNWVAGVNASQVQINPLDGKLTFVYTDVAININNGKFFDLNFAIKAGATGSASFLWSDSPTTREISNSQAKEVSCNYSNGALSIVTGFNLSGKLMYENAAQTPLNNISISLLNSNNQSVGTSTTDLTGSYSFPGLANGNYSIKPDIKTIWGGASAMDITSYKKHIGNLTPLNQVQVKSGDVNGSSSLTSMDLTIIKQRIGAQISAFTTGDWVYDPLIATISGNNFVQNIKALCYGDANGSYTPSTLKSLSNVFLAGKEKINSFNTGEFEMPFKLNKAVNQLSSVTLAINYPSELLDVKGIKMIANNEDLYYSVKDGKINVVYSTLNSLDLKEGDLLMTIQFSLKKDASHAITNDNHLDFSGSGEFGDYNDNVLDGIKLQYSTFDFNTLINEFSKDEIKVYPNPASNLLTVTNVNDTNIDILDMVGRSLLSVHCQSNSIVLDIHSLLSGSYILKVNRNNSIIYKKFTVVK